MRVFLALCLAVGVGGCNMVVSDKPLFSPADEAGPVMREGVWLQIDEVCPVNLDESTDWWPECANWGVLRNGVLQRPTQVNSEANPDWYEAWSQTPVVLAAGEPMILQAGSSHDEPFFAEWPEPRPALWETFNYQAVEPTALDEEGRIVAAMAWTVQCGPRARKANGRLETQTRDFLPGLVKRGSNCTAAAPEAVINAARASREWTPAPTTFRWIRDGSR